MYASFGVRKSPGVVKGSSAARFRGGFWAKQYSIRLTMRVLNPLRRRSSM
jgi:hypothetical protein